jgi:predicted secreted protein
MERIAQPVPKPCYAVEFDLSNPVCQECEFQKSCFESLGPRKHKVTLDKVEFSLVPKAFGLTKIPVDDPELPTIERTYIVCHQTIFGRRPKDKIGQHLTSILANVRKSKVAIRMFMLANMVAYQQQQRVIAEKSDASEKRYYSSKLLTYANSITRVEMFREMCQKEFGTFNLSSLDTLTEGGYAENDIERRMEHSEITAAKTLIGYKIRNGGPAWTNLYDHQELTLDPHWLATEDTYKESILTPYWAGNKGTRMLANHRYSVCQVLAQMKKKKDWAIAVFQARERIVPLCLGRVLHSFGYSPKDFEVEQLPVTNMMDFWLGIARAIQHVECIRYIDGDRSVFKR